MSDKLFPQRQRCKSCGKKLGDNGAPVFLGLYCTARCASMAEPVTDPDRAPRECKTQRDGRWVFKRRYRSEGEIPGKLRDDPSSNWYWCTSHCGALHIGHSRIDLTREKHRVLGDRTELSDLLVKSRGRATHRQVAAVAGIRPIRIKELEDPASKDPDLDALFKLMAVYRLKLAAVLPA